MKLLIGFNVQTLCSHPHQVCLTVMSIYDNLQLSLITFDINNMVNIISILLLLLIFDM